MLKVRKLNITGIKRKTKKSKPFPKNKNWQSGYGATKKSYKRWMPK